MKPLFGLLAILLAAPATAAETRSVPCTYWSLSGTLFEGECKIVSSTDAEGRYSESVTAGDVTLVLVEVARQGVWSTYTINGQPGVRFEHNREWFSYSTLALDMTLDLGVQD